jgi:hypothetical protein
MPSLLCKPQSGLSGAALDLGIIAPGGVTAVSVMERWKVDVLASDLVRAPSPTHVRTYVRTRPVHVYGTLYNYRPSSQTGKTT